MSHAGFFEHLGHELRHDASAILHLRLLRVGQVRYDAYDVACTRRLARIANDQELHDVIIRFSFVS